MKRRTGIFAFFMAAFLAAGVALSGVAFAFTCAVGNWCAFGSANYLSKRLPEISASSPPLLQCTTIPDSLVGPTGPRSIYNNSSKRLEFFITSNCTSAPYSISANSGIPNIGGKVIRWRRTN